MSPPATKRKPAQKANNTKKAVRQALSLLKDYKLKLAITVICAVVSTVFSVIGPLVLGLATTTVFNGINNMIHHTGTIDFDTLFFYLIVAVALYIVSSVFFYFQSYILVGISNEIICNLRSQIMDKITALSMEDVDENKRGDILSRMINDVDSLQVGISQLFLKLLTAVITIIGVCAMMLYINLWMTLATIVLVPISFLLILIVTKYSQIYFLNQLFFKGSLNSQIEETFTGHDLIRVFNHEEQSIKKFSSDNVNWYDQEWKSQFFSSLSGPALSFISNISYIFIAVLGAIFVLQKTIAVGDILAFFQYIDNFTRPIQQITRAMNLIQTALAATERIFEFLDLDDEENPSDKQITQINDEISFEHVNFSYVPNEKVINDLSFTVKKGEKIAIVGETGSGKTTIIKLLMRFYDIDSGSIKIDGVDIEEYDKNSLRSMIGMVPQDSWLFSDTIANNIRYGKLDASDEEVIEAARQVYADNFIRQLPEGYETVLNEDVDNISYGQKQLLTIARTIISSKEILILDEATASVDTRTEKLIQNAMYKIMENRTSFIIAHRLSTIKDADKILILQNGRIIEFGSHEELLAQKGYYYNTLNSQDVEKLI